MTKKNNATNVAKVADVYVARAAEWDKAQKTVKKMVSVFKSKKFEDVCANVFGDKKTLNVKNLEKILKRLTFTMWNEETQSMETKALMDDKGKVTFFVQVKGEWKRKTRKYDACTWCMKDFMFLMFLVGAGLRMEEANKEPMRITSIVLANATAVAEAA